ncbi:hypothetical protein [Vulcanisaeta sp. JCM 16161]|uniref:hypothetical protein n=1 Tax=Vulcanisaeta sp. JCM 16161 TaxID=1295372 RepID=UPI00406C36E9
MVRLFGLDRRRLNSLNWWFGKYGAVLADMRVTGFVAVTFLGHFDLGLNPRVYWLRVCDSVVVNHGIDR